MRRSHWQVGTQHKVDLTFLLNAICACEIELFKIAFKHLVTMNALIAVCCIQMHSKSPVYYHHGILVCSSIVWGERLWHIS